MFRRVPVFSLHRCLRRYYGDHVRVRFAPSPTGQLHLGGLRTALYNYLFARSHGGKFLLRIEDTDQKRFVPGATESLIHMLEWSGITIDEGPNTSGEHGPYYQSQRKELYQQHIDTLLENGSAYRCFCTARRLDLLRRNCLSRRETPKYDNRCRHLSEEEINKKLANNDNYVVRFKLENYDTPWQDLVYGPIVTDVAKLEGDPVILKSDGYPTYHLANVVDDHLMNITHVLRGVEWQVSTTKHILMYQAFGWQPPQFAHLPLLINKDGKKLSKRHNGSTVEYFKDQGYFPETVLNFLTCQGSGFKVKDTVGLTIDQLIGEFDLSLLNVNSTRLDFNRIGDINRIHLKNRLDGEKTKSKLIEELRSLVLDDLPQSVGNTDLQKDDHLEYIISWAMERITQISDLTKPDFHFLWVLPSSDQIQQLNMEKHSAETLSDILVSLENINDEDYMLDTLKEFFLSYSKTHNVNYKAMMKTLRSVISGLKEGPSVAEMCVVLGKNTIQKRLSVAVQTLQDSQMENQINET